MSSARKPHVMLVASGLGIGGAEVVIQQLTETIDRSRFHVSVCCLKEQGEIGEAIARTGVEVTTLTDPRRQKVDYLTFVKLLKLIRRTRVDLVHTHTTDGLMDAAVCRVLRPKLKLVHTFHFGNYPHLRPGILRMERIGSRMATRLIAVGETQRQQLRAVYGFRDSRIQTLRNGVAIDTGDGAAFRARLGAGHAMVIGTIATLIVQKGLPDLMAVARQMVQRRLDVKFVICGEGPLRGELEALRREYGLEDVVTLAGWVQNASSVALPAFDVFFQPSRWEAMSIALLEAMAARRPVVATDVGEAPYIVQNGVNGLLVKPGDIDGMADALSQVVRDPALGRRIGAAAAVTVRDNFQVHHMTRQYEELYREALGR